MPISLSHAQLKALVIDEPWIIRILSGEKTWEMRRRVCNIRGSIGLIKKGSGRVVGVAEIIDCYAPISSRDAYQAATQFHGIPLDQQEETFAKGWRIPWVLKNARRLAHPVNYTHPSGAVTWVNLTPEISSQIVRQV